MYAVTAVVAFELSKSQGFPKLTKFCSQFPTILLTNADLNSQLYRKQWRYSVQGLLAKVKNTVANG